MTIIEQYSEILQKIASLESSIQIKESELNLFRTGLADLGAGLTELEKLLVSDAPVRIQAAIERAKDSVKLTWNQRIMAKENEINVEQNSSAQQINQIRAKPAVLTEEEQRLQTIWEANYVKTSLNIPKKYHLDQVPDKQNVTVEDIDVVESALPVVLLKYDTAKDPPVEKVINILSCADLFCNINNPKVAVLVMTIYLGLFSLVIVGVPEISLFAYGGLVSASALSLLRKYKLYDTSKLLNAKLYKYLKTYLDTMNAKYEVAKEEEIKSAQQISAEKVANLNKELEQLKVDMQKEIDAQNEKANDPNFIAECDREVKQKIEDMKRRINADNEELSLKEQDFQVNSENLQNLKNRKADLKQEIIDTYINNLKPGDLTTVVDKLFLGFNNDDTLTCIDSITKSNIVLYNGDISEIYPLVMSIVVQIFRTFDITNISLTLSDITSSGTRFNVFKYGNLGDLVDILTTEDQVRSDAVERFYSLMINKNIRISSKADNIREFNDAMFAQNSLTESFDFFLSIDSGKALYSDKMTKLLKEGYLSGIYPLIFVDYQKLRDTLALDKPKEEDLMLYEKILVKDADWYTYITGRNQFVRMGTDQINNTIKSIAQKLLLLRKDK